MPNIRKLTVWLGAFLLLWHMPIARAAPSPVYKIEEISGIVVSGMIVSSSDATQVFVDGQGTRTIATNGRVRKVFLFLRDVKGVAPDIAGIFSSYSYLSQFHLPYRHFFDKDKLRAIDNSNEMLISLNDPIEIREIKPGSRIQIRKIEMRGDEYDISVKYLKLTIDYEKGTGKPSSPAGNGEPTDNRRSAPRQQLEGPLPAKPGSAPESPQPDPPP